MSICFKEIDFNCYSLKFFILILNSSKLLTDATTTTHKYTYIHVYMCVYIYTERDGMHLPINTHGLKFRLLLYCSKFLLMHSPNHEVTEIM